MWFFKFSGQNFHLLKFSCEISACIWTGMLRVRSNTQIINEGLGLELCFWVVLFGLFAGVWLQWLIKISVRLCATEIEFSRTHFICLSLRTSLLYNSRQILLSTYHSISTNHWKVWSPTPNVYYFLVNTITVQYTVQAYWLFKIQ